MPADPSVVEVDLDRVRYLKFDHNACADLDEAMIKNMGVSLFEAFEKDTDADTPPMVLMGPGATRLMLWAGLKWNIPKLSIKRAGEMIGEASVHKDVLLPEITSQCMIAIMKSGLFGKPEKLKEQIEEAESGKKKEVMEEKVPELSPSS